VIPSHAEVLYVPGSSGSEIGPGAIFTPATVYLLSIQLERVAHEKNRIFMANAIIACRTTTTMIRSLDILLSAWDQLCS
jgi:hypothetical protein